MWQIGNKKLDNRLFLGTAGYQSPAILEQAIQHSQVQCLTVALRRTTVKNTARDSTAKDSLTDKESLAKNHFWEWLLSLNVNILPNTAGCRTVKEAVLTAQMARQVFKTNWIKLEVIHNTHHLNPDPFQLVEAARILCAEGFEVFPYTTEDIAVAERLVQAGCRVLMPWAAPIGSGKGLLNVYALKVFRERFKDITLIVDAGIGRPSQALAAMELGFDGVLLNTAVAKAIDPVSMAKAFSLAVKAGRLAFKAGFMPKSDFAKPSTPVVGTPFWHQKLN